MLNTLLPPWPSFTHEEAEAVSTVLLSNRVNYWTGDECQAFEREFAEYTGCRHAIAVANGTVALELALKALDIGPGDEVIVTPRTFLASASSVAMAGARPVFAEVDSDSQNITAETIRAVLTPRTRAVLCVHLAGWPCDLDPILAVADDYGLKVIEDCAQAVGAAYKGRSVGSMGQVGAWSFCQDKIITTGGEGGMLTTNDRALWLRMWSAKEHGKSWEAVHERQHPPGFRWVHESFGTNGRMLELQAAIGRIQLKRMAEWGAARASNAERISEVCRQYPVVRVPQVPPDVTHAWYRLYVFVEPQCLADGWSRDRILEEIATQGVPCYPGSCPEVYLEKAFNDTGWQPSERLPVARRLGETSVTFLVHPTLTPGDIGRICEVVGGVLSRASR